MLPWVTCELWIHSKMPVVNVTSIDIDEWNGYYWKSFIWSLIEREHAIVKFACRLNIIMIKSKRNHSSGFIATHCTMHRALCPVHIQFNANFFYLFFYSPFQFHGLVHYPYECFNVVLSTFDRLFLQFYIKKMDAWCIKLLSHTFPIYVPANGLNLDSVEIFTNTYN